MFFIGDDKLRLRTVNGVKLEGKSWRFLALPPSSVCAFALWLVTRLNRGVERGSLGDKTAPIGTTELHGRAGEFPFFFPRNSRTARFPGLEPDRIPSAALSRRKIPLLTRLGL